MDESKKVYWIDVMRAFACVMVLFAHAPQQYSGQPGQWLMAINNYYGVAWGPILFFMISGACVIVVWTFWFHNYMVDIESAFREIYSWIGFVL